MSFKLRSTVLINENISGEFKTHKIFSKVRSLLPGDVIQGNGLVAEDSEAKTWNPAHCEIKINPNSLTIKWRKTLIDSILSVSPSGPEGFSLFRVKESEKDEPEITIEASTPLELKDCYHSEPKFSEIFDWNEKRRIKHLIEQKLKELEGIKEVVRETELVYEP